jgi:hypothetical protein
MKKTILILSVTIQKTVLLLFLCLAGAIQTWAYDFEMDGIYYNYISGTNEVEVTYKDDNYHSYSGYVYIPSTITYSGVTYDVTKIGDRAFSYLPISDPNAFPLRYVSLPNSVTVS